MAIPQIANDQVAAARKHYEDDLFKKRGHGAHPGTTEDAMTFTTLTGEQRKEKEAWTPGDAFDTVTGENGEPITIFNQWTARDNQQFHPFGQEIAAERMASVGQKDYFQLRKDLFDMQGKNADLQVSLMERIRNAGSGGKSTFSKKRNLA
jgi:hypothetical protein